MKRRNSDSLRSCAKARGHEHALGPDAFEQLREWQEEGPMSMNDAQRFRYALLAATEQVNRVDTRCASATHLRR